MAEPNDYLVRLNKARKKRNRNPYRLYIIIAASIIAVIAIIFFAGKGIQKAASSDAPTEISAPEAGQEAVAPLSEDIPQTRSAEELAREQEAADKQAVVDTYQNLGLVQVSGYLNVRETATANGKIIGKLQQNSACEILNQEGEWFHISSGGLEGYIHGQFVVTGDDARAKALEYVSRRAIVKAQKLNIRTEPVPDAANIVGQALINERYEVIGEADGWIQIGTGYISAEFCEVTYALNEARVMDLKAMAIDQYENLLISKVDSYLNIRSSAADQGTENIIGKLPSRAAGEILDQEGDWYKIKSGQITGFVNAQYVAVGQEARDLAVESASLMAIVNTDKLNVRLEPSTDSKIWTQISKEDRYAVSENGQLDGWVQIELDAGEEEAADKAFISTRDNNVEVRYALEEAIKFSPLEEAANLNASTRNRLVNYALQFVGNRYVWGGTNPNTGADCSGFVQYVLRNSAGVSLPRTSREQAKTGKAINSSEMRPGDLIYYANSSGTVNHVAMYIGNGQIVHAASRRSGIRISTWNYRTPKTIRSYLD